MFELTNITAYRSAIAAKASSEEIAQGIERLSTGSTINSAADNAAGLAIAGRIDSQVRGLEQGIRNASYGIEMVDTADTVLNDLIEIMQRMRELLLQQVNGTVSLADNNIIQSEIDGLRISLATQGRMGVYNGQPLFTESKQTSFHVGANLSNPLVVDFPKLVETSITSQQQAFTNGDFELDSPGGSSIGGWDIVEQVVTFGTDELAGVVTPSDAAPYGGTDQNNPSNLGSMEVTTSNAQASEGSQSVRLTSSGITTSSGFDTVRGPALVSKNSIALEAGDSISFDWRAQGGQDAYDVYAYLLDTSTGQTLNMLNDTGATPNATTNWQSESVTVTDAGNYKFIFVGGTFDATGGRAAGAQLFVDNISANSTIQTVEYEFSLATATLSDVDDAIDTLLKQRAGFGAAINRLTHVIDGQTRTGLNAKLSHSRIVDTDYATVVSQLTAAQIKNRAANAMLAQANSSQDLIITLLKD
jgi:flagellin-like hook-associated protein FlgL